MVASPAAPVGLCPDCVRCRLLRMDYSSVRRCLGERGATLRRRGIPPWHILLSARSHLRSHGDGHIRRCPVVATGSTTPDSDLFGVVANSGSDRWRPDSGNAVGRGANDESLRSCTAVVAGPAPSASVQVRPVPYSWSRAGPNRAASAFQVERTTTDHAGHAAAGRQSWVIHWRWAPAHLYRVAGD